MSNNEEILYRKNNFSRVGQIEEQNLYWRRRGIAGVL
jgi:hypothetical protein